jgi:hypothetical protein
LPLSGGNRFSYQLPGRYKPLNRCL